MPKYANNQEYRSRSRANQNVIAQGFNEGLQNFAKAFVEGKERENDREILEKMEDPSLNRLQRVQLSLKLSKRGSTNLFNSMAMENRLQREQRLLEKSDEAEANRRLRDEERRAHEEEIVARNKQEQGYRESREARLRQENESTSLTRIYQERLKDLRSAINDAASYKDRESLKAEQNALHKELGSNLQRLKKNQPPVSNYFDFSAMAEQEAAQAQEYGNQVAPQAQMPQAGMNAPQQAQPQPQFQGQPQGKVPWDPTNPEHIAFGQEAMRVSGGDKAKTNELLSQYFTKG